MVAVPRIPGPYGYAYSAHIAVEFKLKTYFGQAKYLSLIASQSPSVFRKIICKVFRFKSVEVGNPSFDKIFYIHCCDHNFVNQLFNQVIQTKFLGYIDKRPYLFIYKRKLTLSFWNIQEEENEYDRIIDLAINFYNEMKSLGHC